MMQQGKGIVRMRLLMGQSRLRELGHHRAEGMVVGEYSRDVDLNVNICREKKLTNIRAAGRDENIIITPHREMGLEEGIEWIADDELVEVTPQSVRLRKKILRQADRPRRRQEELEN